MCVADLMGWDLGCWSWCHSPAAPDVPSQLSWTPSQSLLQPCHQQWFTKPTRNSSFAKFCSWGTWSSRMAATAALPHCPLRPAHTDTTPHRHNLMGMGHYSDPPPKQLSALLFIRNTGVIKLYPGAPFNLSLIMFVKSAPFEIGWWCSSHRWLKRNTPQTCAFIQEWHNINCSCVGNDFPGSVPFILGLFPLFVLLFSDINFPYFYFSSVQHLQKGTIFSDFFLFSYVNPYKKIISKCWHNSLPHLNAADEG